MNHEAVIAWTGLYIAVGSSALICACLAVIVTIYELHSGAWRPALTSKMQIVLALPKLWLRWQKNYFLGAPVVLMIGLGFANHVGFDTLWDIEPTAKMTANMRSGSVE